MTGNKLLDYLLSIEDEDTGICELLELLNKDRCLIIEMLTNSYPIIRYEDKNLVLNLIKICTILEFKLDKSDLPCWVFDKRLYLDRALFVGKHLDDFTKVMMFIKSPQAFLNRNVFFNLNGLERV